MDTSLIGRGDPASPQLSLLNASSGPWSVERSYDFCEKFLRAHHDRFPDGPPPEPGGRRRRHLVALYAFLRSADDFADEPQYEGQRVAAFSAWEEELQRCFHGEAFHPMFVALQETIEACDLPFPPFQDLLDAFRWDLGTSGYSTFEALRCYTARSAEPLGRLLLGVFGHVDPRMVRFADEISTALQLASFWWNLVDDAGKGRIYVPGEDLHFFGVPVKDLSALGPNKSIRELVRYEVARTRALFERGRPLLGQLSGDAEMTFTFALQAGMRILDDIEDADFDVMTVRRMEGARDKPRILETCLMASSQPYRSAPSSMVWDRPMHVPGVAGAAI